jgi:hypothetical protein
VVEGTGLENRRTGNGTVSSNLTLSVKKESGFRIAPFASTQCAGSRIAVFASTKSFPHPARKVLANDAMQDADCFLRDGWPSGLRRTPGKCVYVKAYREFESHPVR